MLLVKAPCTVTGWLESEDTFRSLRAVESLGARITSENGTLHLSPPAPDDLPRGTLTIDCGNSGTTTRLLCGLLAGWLPVWTAKNSCEVILQGDASLSSRPMARVVNPLRAMGADIQYLKEDGCLPLRVRGARLSGCVCRLDAPSAQVKSALILAAMNATGETIIQGAGSSRDHTERMLTGMGISIDGFPGTGDLSLKGKLPTNNYHLQVPADPSSAAFFQVAAALVVGSVFLIKNQSLNEGRTGALEVLKRAGAVVEISNSYGLPGECLGDVKVSHNNLKAFTIEAAEIPALIDELPVLAVLATQARGETLITGAAELRIKESDRLAAMARALKSMGANIEELPDGWRIIGPTPLRGGAKEEPVIIETMADHRIAMALAVAALISSGTTALDDDTCVGVSYPNFFQTLDNLLNRT